MSLYSPLSYSIHFGSYYGSKFKTATVELRNGTNKIMASVRLSAYEAVITADGSDVLYSVSGNYVAVLIEHYNSYTDNYTFPFNITVTGTVNRLYYREYACYICIYVHVHASLYVLQCYYLCLFFFFTDPTVQASKSEVEVFNGQTTLKLSCTPSSPILPVIWREGQRTLVASDTAGVVLTPDGLYHELTLDLNTFSLSGDDIVCEVVDPEDDRGVVASATIDITISTEG